MIRELVVATHNVKKGREMAHFLGGVLPDLTLKTLADWKGAPEPEETGTTYSENATIKALSAAKFTGQWCVADDAGLEIDAMDGQPGLHSKRFAGEETPFDEKMRIILDRLQDVPEDERTARFRLIVALCSPNLQVELFEGVCEGRIAQKPIGDGGFGYDPIFFLPQLNRSMAQLTREEKHAVSHRGVALGKLVQRLGR